MGANTADFWRTETSVGEVAHQASALPAAPMQCYRMGLFPSNVKQWRPAPWFHATSRTSSRA